MIAVVLSLILDEANAVKIDQDNIMCKMYFVRHTYNIH